MHGGSTEGLTLGTVGICIGTCIREEMTALMIQRHRTIIRLAMPPGSPICLHIIVVLQNKHRGVLSPAVSEHIPSCGRICRKKFFRGCSTGETARPILQGRIIREHLRIFDKVLGEGRPVPA